MANKIFVGPGDSINAAVNNPNTQPGDVIIVRPGVYHESVTVPIAMNDIRIVSEKPYGAVLDGTGQGPNGFMINAVGIMVNGFVIRNFTGHGIQVTRDSARLIDNHIKDVGGRGIDITAVPDENLVWKNTIHDVGTDGIFSAGCCNLYYQNDVRNVGASGISETLCCSTFYRNYVENTGGTGIQGFACCNAIVNNVVKNSGNHGIDLFTFGDDDLVFGNKVLSSTNLGINGGQFGFETLIGNEVTNSGDTGVVVNDEANAVLNNTVRKNAAGIMTLDSLSSENDFILNNLVKENQGDGIEINSTSLRTFAGANRIEDNGGSGIEVLSNFTNVEENKIEGNQNNGILITGANGTFVLRNRLEDNDPRNIQDNGTNTVRYQNKKD